MIVFLALVCAHYAAEVYGATTASPLPNFRTVCYTEGWAHWRQDDFQYQPEDMDVSLCTHLVYQYAELSADGLNITVHDNGDADMYRKITALKSSTLKVMLNLGSYNIGSDEFTKTVSNAANMHTFAANTLDFLNKYNFDGLDMDWEFPGDRGSPAADKERYANLLKILQQAFSDNNGRPLILSMTMNPTQYRINMSYKLPDDATDVDFINLMAFGLHGSWEGVVGHHSSLYSPTEDESDSIDYMVNWILQTSIPREKLNLGLPFYGLIYNLTDPTRYYVGAPIGGTPAATERGSTYNMQYDEICHLLNEHNDTVSVAGRLPETNSPFMVDGNRWTGYDDVQSIEEKVDYAIQKGMGGVAVFSINMDDFNNLCGGGEYPLLNAVHNRITAGVVG